MATGWNTTNTLSDSLDDIRNSARTYREYANVMGRLMDTERLPTGNGLDWKEVALSKLYAMNIEETTDLEQNPQELADTLFSIRPTLVGMSIFTTDLMKMRINPKVAAKIGVLVENAMSRKKDIDAIAIAQSATTDLGTAGNPMSSDLVSAAGARVEGNSTEPWDGGVVAVMKRYHIHDLRAEGMGGFGTAPVPAGLTEQFYRRGFSGSIDNIEVFRDDNISVDASDDAIAFVFARGSGGAIVHVEGMESRMVTERKEGIGGGAEIMYATDQYGNGVRQQAWIYAITADASNPTA